MEVSPLVQNTFTTSYLVLMGYTIITFIEAIRTPNASVRHIMNLETAVSIVAGMTYGLFLERLKEPKVDLHSITELRYIDWSITTPLILLAILIFYNPDYKNLHYGPYLSIVLLNWGMLLMGYLGETGKVSKAVGLGTGFAFYAALLALLYTCCIPAGTSLVVFGIFAAIWTFYGVAYAIQDEEKKQVAYNVLDVVSKALFGMILWLYFGKVVNFDS